MTAWFEHQGLAHVIEVFTHVTSALENCCARNERQAGGDDAKRFARRVRVDGGVSARKFHETSLNPNSPSLCTENFSLPRAMRGE